MKFNSDKSKNWRFYTAIIVMVAAVVLIVYVFMPSIAQRVDVTSIVLRLNYVPVNSSPIWHFITNVTLPANSSFTSAVGTTVNITMSVYNNRTVSVNLTQMLVLTDGFGPNPVSTWPSFSPSRPLVLASKKTALITLQLRLPQSAYDGRLLLGLDELGVS